jgi:cyclase
MLRKRIIPRILIRKIGDRQAAVISKNFNTYFTIGDPLSQARIMDSNRADEISVINTDQHSSENHFQFSKLLNQIVKNSMTPISAGGGINSYEDASLIMGTGIEKITIPVRAAATNISIVEKIAKRYGSQAVQISLDYFSSNKFFSFKKSNQVFNDTEICAILKRYIEAGAGEVVFCNIEHDGSKNGLDLTLFNLLKGELSVPLLLGGGIKDIDNFVKAFRLGADGVISGTYIAKMDHSLIQIRSKIAVQGINVREIIG